ncbi:hypothetical protein cypCar_00040414 [Cyprinus carpio]|nr:hypothetical protein cypCar_00040414 [Cyprinus carpio]
MGKLVEYQHILSATIIQVCFRWCEDQVLHKLAKILEIRRLEANRTSLPTPQQLVQFVRQGSGYWQWDEMVYNDLSIYPKPISRLFTGIPSNPDAAFTWTNGKMYFFKETLDDQ